MGDLTHNEKSRKQSLESYYKDPKYCLHCGKIIKVPLGYKVSDIKKKKFCDHSCSASFNNNLKTKRRGSKTVPTGRCKRCGKVINYQKRADRINEYRKVKFCPDCRIIVAQESLLKTRKKNGALTWDIVSEMTKDELFEKMGRDPYKFKLRVTSHAQTMWNKYNKKSGCELCDFQFHVICHKKAVKDFSGSTKIKEINDESNLIGLCPNHHWLLDHGLLEL